ncbi:MULTISPECIES: hypothetical protein [unclassified Planococcus (in: firmicutes)]|uniref:hypothetical protein n=1 Tax=unclassified Planococcus (in: firmicutes) TaxID=2662419 RepID=UPI000C342209|nr:MULTISPECIES: hypothetical protein [unclassified Planococcus (in: firmicutes)]AUD12848.1 hypothetical protein CW734_03135 [Planococcus sp. MB-3u-03]PKG47466.1 hypothetical protein CXF66_03240 [Planococcus sp. Urea-trap-24]PKG88210.1 hypothetical protein CXF91_13025 [Planococcus sp. Urea-3u-39]PKH36865.1 hypothetical protein CXF77_13185 [Planococcus sp. MB-3u-09]
MKGFLSLLGITLIAVFCGLILLGFYNEPFEDWQNQERLQAYTETRDNLMPEQTGNVQQAVAPGRSTQILLYADASASCPAP